MIARDQALKAINKYPKIDVSKEQLESFSKPYRILGLILINQLYNGYSNEGKHLKAYQEQFSEDALINPWTTKEGQQLANLLYGSVLAPYIAEVWDFINSLPYQSDYSRRPFRIATCSVHTLNKLACLIQLYCAGKTGYNSMPIEDQIVYAIYQEYGGSGMVFSIAIAKNHAKFYPLLEEIILGEHDIGGVSTALIKALLLTNNDDNHLLIEKLLLAAQQQEGLRQTILETLDFTSAKAFKRFLKVILANNLARFSSVVRAVDTWFGFGWEAPKAATITRILELADKYLNQPAEMATALKSQDSLAVYVALWSKAFDDVDEANALAFSIVCDADTDKIKKLVALFFVAQTGWTRNDVVDYAEKHLGEDVELDYWLLINFPRFTLTDNLFKNIWKHAINLPSEGKSFAERGFSWKSYIIKPAYFFDMLIQNGSEKHLEQLATVLSSIPSASRAKLLYTIFPNHTRYNHYDNGLESSNEKLNFESTSWKRKLIRQAVLDRNSSVSDLGCRMMNAIDLYPEDIEVLEQMLARKGKDLRKASIKTLVKQSDKRLKRSIEQLISSNNIDQRLGALELLTVLEKDARLLTFVKEQITAYQSRILSKNEQVFIDRLTKQTSEFNYLNGFGAIDYTNLTEFHIPQEIFKRKTGIRKLFGSDFLFGNLIDIDKTTKEVNKLFDLFEEHKRHEYQYEGYQGEVNTAVIDDTFTYIKLMGEKSTDRERLDSLPLHEVWESWYRQANLNDFEIYSVAKFCELRFSEGYDELSSFQSDYLPNFKNLQTDTSKYYHVSRTSKIAFILNHLANAYADKFIWISYKLDVLEDALYHFPQNFKKKPFKIKGYYYREKNWLEVARELLYDMWEGDANVLPTDQKLRLWKLQLYMAVQEMSFPEKANSLAELIRRLPTLLAAENTLRVTMPFSFLSLSLHAEGQLTTDDLLLQALLSLNFFELLDGRKNRLGRFVPEYFNIPQINSRLKRNLLSVELSRGDLPTEASKYIHRMTRIEGMHYFFEVLSRMGKDKFDRGYSYGIDVSKKRVFSQVLKLVVPTEEEDVALFIQTLKAAQIDHKRLIEVACYATQWTDWLGTYLQIEQLGEAVWWFIAHTTDYMDAEKETIISRYSNVPKNDFQRGGIDIDWFHRVYKTLGKSNWKLLHESAKYLSDGMGYRRVKLYSSVLLGETKITESLKKVLEKRDKDYVMAFGLIPISKSNPEGDLLKRYNILQNFLKESKQFGAQRQESEKNAVEIGLDNLARNAGFDDSVRFGWAMEGEATQEIMENATRQLDDDVRVQLLVDNDGKAALRIEKGGKILKGIPDKYKKDKRVEALKERKSYLTKQYSRTRLSLENAMLSADQFTAKELNSIMQHPVVKALLRKLVLFNVKNATSGFWKNGVLENFDGTTVTMHEEDSYVIAHPSHLYHAVQWDRYQRYLFEEGIQQPFKQVFRELYIPTADELEQSNRSERYQGHQVQPKKALVLLRARGWTVHYEAGLQKVFHKAGYLATIYAMADWFSPADVEAPTLEYVRFHAIKDGHAVPLTEIDPIIFSEVMRDLDLVVSVAHVGGVDPEASHSSMQMRSVLAAESARLFKLSNVEIKERHILIKGKLGDYTIHLGSGLVSKDGLQLSIIPIHSQHRGRIFLPFLDDDPKSAEIISKMRLLAQDNTIKDPTILAQINK